MNIRTLIGFIVAVGCCLTAGQAWADEVGQIIAVNPGAFAERGGETVPLDLKSQIYANDTLVTDATGKLQVLFADDSTVSLSPDTRLSLTTVIPQGEFPTFEASLVEGMVRFITGKIVEQNPDGFSLMTPESTIGIRGTIFAVSRDGSAGTTSVFVLNTARQVIMNGISIPSYHKLSLPGGEVMPMTPADIQTVNTAAAIRSQMAEAENAAASGAPLPDTAITLAALESTQVPAASNSMASSILHTEDSGTGLVDNIGGGGGGGGGGGSSSMNGSISGILSGGGINGTFSFDANLGSHSITNAQMSGSGGTTSFAFSNGNGNISGSHFGVYYFPNGTFTYNGAPQTNTGGSKLEGGVQINGSTVNVDGTFRVRGDSGNYVAGKAVGHN